MGGLDCQSCSADQFCYVSGCFATGGGSSGGGSDMGGGGGGTAAGGGGGTGNADVELSAVRAAADVDGGAVSLPVDGVLVTYVKPLVVDAGASDPAGFFVQSSAMGPALFVAVDATSVMGGPLAVGDSVRFVVTGLTKNGGVRTATGISGLMKSSSGNPVSGLNREVSAIDFSQAGAIDAYESGLVTLSGTVGGSSASAGSGYRGIPFGTASSPVAADGGFVVQLRLPWALANAQDLTPGCAATLGPVPMWRFNARAQPSAFANSEVTQVACPAPKVSFARATAATSVLVGLDRNVAPASVLAGDFTIGGAGTLNVSMAALTAPRQVTLTTAPQTPGASYTVTAGGITDTRGTAVDAMFASAMFTGFSPDGGMDAGTPDAGHPDAGSCALTNLVISQVKSRGTDGGNDELVELYNPTGAAVTLDNTWVLTARSSTSSTYTGRWIGAGATLAAHAHYLVAGTSYFGPPAADAPLTSGITDTTSLVLAHGGATIDAVCFGAPTDMFDAGYICEGAPANNLPHDNSGAGMSNTDVSIERLPGGALGNCTDTNNNAADFVSRAPSYPHDLASPPVP
jgi:hypothetical protein